MKTFFILSMAALTVFSSAAIAQIGYKGIYKTESDFRAGHATLYDKHTRIRLHELFNTEKLEVCYKDSTYSFLKNDLYGYVDENGNAYRFFKGNTYSILNPSEKILLYRQTSGTGLKNSPHVETYFFSKETGSEILPLNLRNLESVFASDTVFEELIETTFENDSQLINYDVVHKIYKLNRLRQLSMNRNFISGRHDGNLEK